MDGNKRRPSQFSGVPLPPFLYPTPPSIPPSGRDHEQTTRPAPFGSFTGNSGTLSPRTRAHSARGRVTESCSGPGTITVMATDSYRGFTFEPYHREVGDQKRALRATRGCITLFVEVSDGDLPSGWHLRDILEYEINRLLEPTTLRHVDKLN